MLEFFKPLKPLSIGFHHVNPHFPWNVINECNKILFLSHGHVFHGATITKGFVACLFVPLYSFVAYCLPSMHALLANVEVGWEILLIFMPSPCFGVHKHFSYSNVQVNGAKTPSNCLLHVNARRWPHLLCIPPWKSSFIPPTMHSFNPFDKNLLIKSKVVCNLDTWSTFANSSHFSYCFSSNNNGTHSNGLATISSSKCTLRGEIIFWCMMPPSTKSCILWLLNLWCICKCSLNVLHVALQM